MKIRFATVILLIVSFSLLTACQNPFSKLGQDDGQTFQQETVGTNEIKNDKEYSCKMLKSPVYQNECEINVNSIIIDNLNSEIREFFDFSRCGELPDKMEEDCRQYIEATKVTGPLSDNQINLLKEALSYSYKTEESGDEIFEVEYYDILKCATLTHPGLKEYCENMLNGLIEQDKMFSIIESSDITKCDELSSEDIKQQCKNIILNKEKDPFDEMDEI